MPKPTIGRVVWFQPSCAIDAPLRGQPFAALIAFVHSETLINIGYFDQNGQPGAATSVKLLAEGETPPERGYFAEWMPYQTAQAKKQEAEQAPVPNSALPPHQQRVIAEHDELNEKANKLAGFLVTPTYSRLPDDEQARLSSQLEYMIGYARILSERIAAF